MKVLVLFRGSAGVGKSTFIKNNNLEEYTVSLDSLRMLCDSFTLNENGVYRISSNSEKKVFELLECILTERMSKGVFTIVDATNYKLSYFKRYKKFAQKYGYKILTVDMTTVPVEECKKRNMQRDSHKIVPEHVVDKMYYQFQQNTIPIELNPIKTNELMENITIEPIDLSKYEKVNVIGDIHGCFSVINKYTNGSINEKEFYIFVGDYLDRGIENSKVIKFILNIYEKDNVVFLKGNHEKWLNDWSLNKKTKSWEFEINTKKILHLDSISQKQTKKFCENLKSMFYFCYNDNKFIVTHGGISSLPDMLVKISDEEFINGSCQYDTDIDELFSKNTKEDNIYQIHGHRNVKKLPIRASEKSFNLEGKVEKGGCLRILEISNDGFNQLEIKNDIFNKERFGFNC